MMRPIRSLALACVVLTAATVPRPARAATAVELTRDSGVELNKLYARHPSAKILGEQAKGCSSFRPWSRLASCSAARSVKRQVVGYYNSVAVSYGFQAGVQKFGYALFFMTNAALDQLDATHGFEVGVGPSLVVVDEGLGRSITSNTITGDVYAFIFHQRSLMAGAGIQGSKITRIDK